MSMQATVSLPWDDSDSFKSLSSSAVRFSDELFNEPAGDDCDDSGRG